MSIKKTYKEVSSLEDANKQDTLRTLYKTGITTNETWPLLLRSCLTAHQTGSFLHVITKLSGAYE